MSNNLIQTKDYCDKSPGAGCNSLNGTSVTNSPPKVPQFNFTLTEYEITIPMDSPGNFPS